MHEEFPVNNQNFVLDLKLDYLITLFKQEMNCLAV